MEEKNRITEKLKEACSFDCEKKESYGQIRVIESRWDGEKQVEIKAEISLINADMLRLELEYAVENPLLYFYEFFGEAKINLDNFYYYRPYLFYDYEWWNESYGMTKVTIYTEEEFERNQNGDNGQICFYGELFFATSPAIAKKSVIVIEGIADDKELYRLYNTYNDEIERNSIVSNNEIINKLDEIFNEKIREAKIDIYNVAQANFINCILNNKKNVLFDVGVSRFKCDRESKEVQAALNEISKLLINGIILSHWDLDHILGIAYTHDTAKDCTWIAPDFRKLYDAKKHPLSVLRLCNFLIKNGKGCLCLIDTSQINKQFFSSKDGKINLWLGEPKSSNGINRANNGGLLLKFENLKSILLTGDCENSIHPKGIYSSNLDYIVIPHHGSIMTLPKAKGKKGSTAYVSYGKKRGHCNLDSNLRKKYKRKNFTNLCRTKMLDETHVKYTAIL